MYNVAYCIRILPGGSCSYINRSVRGANFAEGEPRTMSSELADSSSSLLG
jgi:hypothetical protein